MAGKRRRGGRRGFRVGKYVNMGFKIAGGLIAASPAIKAASDHRGDPQNIPTWIALNYTGLDITNGNFDTSKATAGIGAVVAGVIVAKIGGFLGRRF